MKNKKGFATILFISLFLVNCKKDPEVIITTYDRFIIYLTNDYKIVRVENYRDNSLYYFTTFNYKTNLVEIVQTYNNIKFLRTSKYFLNNVSGLADSCIDSTFSGNELSRVTTSTYNYDTNGYRKSVKIINKSISNGLVSYTYEEEYRYEVKFGNITSVGDWSCSYFYGFNDLNNKLDIFSFHSDYIGKKNVNLMKSSNTNCPPGPATTPSTSDYEYTLNSLGLVNERIENYTSGYYRGEKPSKEKRISHFEYKF